MANHLSNDLLYVCLILCFLSISNLVLMWTKPLAFQSIKLASWVFMPGSIFFEVNAPTYFFIFQTNFFKGITSCIHMPNLLYPAFILDFTISVWSFLIHIIGKSATQMTNLFSFFTCGHTPAICIHMTVRIYIGLPVIKLALILLYSWNNFKFLPPETFLYCMWCRHTDSLRKWYLVSIVTQILCHLTALQVTSLF